MIEAEWLASEDPEAMLKAAEYALASAQPHTRRTARKRECFGVACCRLLWPLIARDELLRRGLEILENELDAEDAELENGSEETWGEMNVASRHPADDAPWFKMFAADVLLDYRDPDLVTARLVRTFEAWEGSKALPGQVAHVMRDVVGNPFRPVTFDPDWRTDTVLSLAQQMYDARDFSAMPILADALQDAGCDSDDILSHCRDPKQVHLRGCWVVDLVLGKS